MSTCRTEFEAEVANNFLLLSGSQLWPTLADASFAYGQLVTHRDPAHTLSHELRIEAAIVLPESNSCTTVPFSRRAKWSLR
jgi:hypothetical protein